MDSNEIFSILKTVFDFLLLILILLVLESALTGTKLLSVNLMVLGFVTVAVGAIANIPRLMSRLRSYEGRSDGI